EKSYGSYNGTGYHGFESDFEYILPNGYIDPIYYQGIYASSLGYSATYADIEMKFNASLIPYYATSVISGSGTRNYRVAYHSYQSYRPSIDRTTPAVTDGLSVDFINQELEYRSFVYENYLQIDTDLKEKLLALAEANGIDPSSPTCIDDVAKYIRSAGKYDLEAGDVDYDDMVTAFLIDKNPGVCRHFAASATMMLRALGIPARYTVGFVLYVNPDQRKEYQNDGHAWVEVYMDGMGWVVIDATFDPDSVKGEAPASGNNNAGNSGSGSGSSGSSGSGSSGSGSSGSGSGGSGSSGSGSGGNGSGSGDDSDIITIALTPKTQRKKYDGTPLYPKNELNGFDELAKEGYTYVVTVSGKQTEYGYGASHIETLVIKDKHGNVVSEQNSKFKIVKGTGILQVYYSEITVVSYSIEKEYDGIPLDTSSCVKYSGNLMSGHTVSVVSTASVNAGERPNTFNLTVRDENGNDVTKYYYVRRASIGTLTVNQRTITIKVLDAEKPYDGTALTSDKYEILEEDALIDGHIIKEYVIVGSQTEIGRSDNIILSVLIVDEYGNDVTGNYAIVPLPGQLKVTVK
ncbi:MAG: transglutaminase domain-containing protein, partial [Clostridia bacterium]|nr:transglutaminase domain-containing protein [Clostridia bacterium]